MSIALETIGNVVTILGTMAGMVAVPVALISFREGVTERRRDLRWRKAEKAKQLIDELRTNVGCISALKMIDWSGATYAKPDGSKTLPITNTVRRQALRTENTIFDQVAEPDSEFVRDCYDRLLEHIDLIENYVNIELIHFCDIDAFFRYYAEEMLHPGEFLILSNFAETYGYRGFIPFLRRFT